MNKERLWRAAGRLAVAVLASMVLALESVDGSRADGVGFDASPLPANAILDGVNLGLSAAGPTDSMVEDSLRALEFDAPASGGAPVAATLGPEPGDPFSSSSADALSKFGELAPGGGGDIDWTDIAESSLNPGEFANSPAGAATNDVGEIPVAPIPEALFLFVTALAGFALIGLRKSGGA